MPDNSNNNNDESLEEQLNTYVDFEESDSSDDDDDDNSFITASNSYVSKESIYNDSKSSGFTFVFVGFFGLFFVLLNFIGIIRIISKPSHSLYMYVVMGVVFLGFVVYGILSYVKSNKLKADVDAELKLTDDIINNFMLFSEDIDRKIDAELSPELKYFERISLIKNNLTDTYPDIDEEYLEATAEKIYEKIFGDN